MPPRTQGHPALLAPCGHSQPTALLLLVSCFRFLNGSQAQVLRVLVAFNRHPYL